MIKKYDEYLTENVEIKLDKKYGFYMFLKLLDDLKLNFIKTNHYLNTGRYLYFFTTEAIKNKNTIDLFENVISLEIIYKTLKENEDKRLSFYFGIKGYNLEYGICDDISHEVYKTGSFQVDNRYLKNLRSYKCLIMINGILQKSNIKNLILLQEIRSHFKGWFPEKGKTIILSENILKKSIPKSELKDEKYENILFKYEKWCEKFKWINKVYYYLDDDNDEITFYIKIKPIEKENI